MSLTPSDLQRALDNTQPYSNYSELGLFHFWRKAWPDVFDNPFSRLHYRIIKAILELYHPKYETRHQRQAGIIIHRESGKSTLDSFAWPLTCVWLRGAQLWVRYDAPGWEGADTHDYDIVQLPPLEENFILIASETATRSENFVTDIKVDLESRPDLDRLFGAKKPTYIQLEDDEITSKQMWRQNAITTSNGVTIWGIGAGQQTRGIKVRNRRPSLIVTDDMYSRKNTKTDTIRENLNYWYFAELENSADTQRGKMLWVGTIVHNETVPTKLLESELYKTIRIPIIEQWELEDVLKHCKKDGKKFTVPPRDVCLKMQTRLQTMSWPERHDLHSILMMYKKAYENHDLSYFYQEYLNIAVAPEEVKYEWDKFQPVSPQREMHHGEPVMVFDFDGRKWMCHPVWYYGVDLASSENVKADETVITVGSILHCISSPDDQGRRKRMIAPYIEHIEHGRGWGVYADGERRGLVETLRGLVTRFPGKWYEVDAHGMQQNIVREVARNFRDNSVPGTVNEHRHSGENKANYIASIMEPIVQKYDYIFYNVATRDSVRSLYNQLTALGSKAKDDIADGTAMMFSQARPSPSPESFAPKISASASSRRRSVGSEPELNALDAWEVS